MTKPIKISSLDSLIEYEDEDYLIINKPSGISTLEDRNEPINILELAKSHYPEIMVGHRLDKHTSGLLVLAKKKEAHRHFSMQLEHREVHKLYHAIVEGRSQFREEEVDLPIYSTSNRSRIDREKGKPSLTLISTLHNFKRHSLLACMPFTGRMHQIRLHLSCLGHPIVADEMYGGHELFLSHIKKNYHLARDTEERPLLSRTALHAFEISFKNEKKVDIHVEAPYPKDLTATVKQLKKNS